MAEYFFQPGKWSANNHWLNTVLIGITDTVTGIQYNEYIIRFPIFCFFAIYVAGVLIAYCRRLVSFMEAYMLLLSYYVDEFFVLARGYAFSLTLIFIGIYEIKKWNSDREMKHLFRAIVFFTFSEIANTIALLPVAALYFLILLLIIKSKTFVKFIYKYWLGLSGLMLVNILMVMYHFKAAKADQSLYCNREGSILDILKEYIGFLLPGLSNELLLVYIILLTVSVIMFFYTKGKIGQLNFTAAWILYLLITYVSVRACDQGFPTGRVLIPGYALFVVSLQEIIDIIGYRLKGKTKNICSILGCLLLCFSFIMQINWEGTRDWGDYATIKQDTYYLWSTQDKAGSEDEKYSSQGAKFYREKILYEYGYDIFDEE